MSSEPSASPDRLLPLGVSLLVILATGLTFWPSLRNGFVNWDDAENLLANLNYRGFEWARLQWMFSTVYKGIYMPLTWLSFALDYRVWGMRPQGYHLTNLLWHCAAAVLLYAIALRLMSKAETDRPVDDRVRHLCAGLTALVFSIHPLRVESVAWITERRDVLSGFFVLLSVLCYLRAVQGALPLYRRRIAAALAAYGAALLSKPSAVPLPLVLLILDVFPLGRLPLNMALWGNPRYRRIAFEKIPFLALSIPLGGVAIAAQHHVGAMTKSPAQSLLQRLAVGAYGFFFYFWKTLWPMKLSPFYRMPQAVSWHDPAYLWSGLFVLGMTVLLILKRRRWPAVLAAWAVYGVFLIPVSGVFHTGTQLAADRYSYLSCMPWALLFGGGAWTLYRARLKTLDVRWTSYALAALYALVPAGLGLLSVRQAHVWSDSLTLWDRVLQLDPDCALAYTNLGNLAMSRGDVPAAETYFGRALAVAPDFPFAHNNQGILELTRGRSAEAERHFRRAIMANPGLAESYSNLGASLYYQGRSQEALRMFQQAVALKADYTDAYYNMGKLMLSFQNPDAATALFQKVLSIDPGYSAVRLALAEIYLSKGNRDQAVRLLQIGLILSPTSQAMQSRLEFLRPLRH